MTEEDAALAGKFLSYLEERFPGHKWAINSRDELLAAIIYVESL